MEKGRGLWFGAANYGTALSRMLALHRGGWSLGETCFGSTWPVDGSNGENRLLTTGCSQAEAWYRAALQARERGLLAPAEGPWQR